MDVNQIRVDLADGIAAAFAAAQDWSGQWKVYDSVPGSAHLPAIVVGFPDAITYGTTMGTSTLEIPLILAVATTSGVDAQVRLNLALSTNTTGSIRDAVKVLSASSWASLQVRSAGNFRDMKVGDVEALCADLNLTITA